MQASMLSRCHKSIDQRCSHLMERERGVSPKLTAGSLWIRILTPYPPRVWVLPPIPPGTRISGGTWRRLRDEKQQLAQLGGQVCQPEHSWHHI